MLAVIGVGKTKTCYALDVERVLKIGPPDRVAKQARRLRRLARSGVPVARVILSGDGWLVQERCDMRTVPDTVVAELRATARAAGYRVHDLHAKNVGWLRSRWVILDCGALTQET